MILDKDIIKNINALLLDLDGTLINSEKAFFNSFKSILKNNYDIDITKEDYKKYELEQNAMLLKTIREKNLSIKNISDKEIMKLIYNDYEKEFKKIILEKETIDNFNMLKELKKLKVTLGLVTTCRKYYLNILIERLKLKDLFDIIIAREDVNNLKPAPDAYITAIETLKIDKNTCLAIEDSKRGIDAAIASGLKTIQVSSFTLAKKMDERAVCVESANIILKEILKVKRNESVNKIV